MSNRQPVLSRVAAALVATVFAALSWMKIRSRHEWAEDHARRAERLQAVASALSGTLSATEAASAVLREGLEALGAGKGVIVMTQPDRKNLSLVAGIGYEPSRLEPWRSFPIDAEYPVNEAMRIREPLFIDSGRELRQRYPALTESIDPGGSAVVVPLLEQGGAIGGLFYRFDELRVFAPGYREYLLALGRLGASAIERARLADADRRASQRAAFLARANSTLTQSLDVEETGRQVAELAVPALADYCSVHLIEPDQSIRTLALCGPANSVDAARRLLALVPPRLDDEGGIGYVIRTATPLHMPSVADGLAGADLPTEVRQDVADLDVGAYLAVPITIHGTTIGALSLTTTRSSNRTFDDDDRALAEELATRAAFAIENARLYSALAGREAQQAAVARLGQLALSESELQPLFDATVSEMANVLDVELTKILQLEPGADQLRLVAGHGWRDGLVGTATEPVGDHSPAGYTIKVDDVVVVRDVETETRFERPPLLAEHGAVSGMTAVIHARPGEIAWGVLGAHTPRRRVFTFDDTNFLVSLGNVLAGAIERRRVLEEERQRQDANRAFIGIVSHELRTPITTIYGGAKLLSRLSSGDPKRDELARDLEADADRLYRLTEDLLVLTRLERGDLEVAREPVLLSRLVERVVASEQKRWPLTEMRLSSTGGQVPVSGEDSYVEQVVRNLVTNAAKYSPDAGHIDVVVTPEGDEVAVRVLDLGPGLRDEDLAHLFSLFYRAPSTAQQASGAGIGLFVCDQLVRAMGGRLWAKRREGGGSEFGFALRRSEEVLLEPEHNRDDLAAVVEVVGQPESLAPLEVGAQPESLAPLEVVAQPEAV